MKNFFKYTFASILGFIIGGLILFFLLMTIVSGMIRSTQKEIIKIESNTVLKIRLASGIADRKSNNPLDNFNPLTLEISENIGLNEILNNLKKAGIDENIDGIYLNLGFVNSGMASLEEIRNGLIKFRETGKFIFAYSDIFTQKSYYLASVADKIYMNHAGIFEFKGLRAEIMFYKGAFDKFGIEPQIVRHGKFKSAIEPYQRKDMSAESKIQIQAYVNTIWNNMLEGISSERNIDKSLLNKYADDLSVRNATKALEYGFIDGIKYKDEVIKELKKKTGQSAEELKLVSMSKYIHTPEIRLNKEYTRDRIAVIYASGVIGLGEGREGTIGSEKLSRAIKKARINSRVKAIVLRVNSGGGDVLSTEIIWREVLLASKAKPVIASMGDYAASGGYYILAPVSKIVAGKNTVTGSIGVFGVFFTAQHLMNDNLGLTVDGVQTNENSGIGSLFRPLTEYEKSILQSSVEETYDIFLNRVAEGRNMEKEEVDKIGQGRVWIGRDAKKIGLIDEFGGLDDAISIAAEEAGITNYRIMELPRIKDPLASILENLGGLAKIRLLQSPIPENFDLRKTFEELFEQKGTQLRIPYELQIN